MNESQRVAYYGLTKKWLENIMVDVRQIINIAPSEKNCNAIKSMVLPSYFVSVFTRKLKKKR